MKLPQPLKPKPVKVRQQMGRGKVINESVFLGAIEDWSLEGIQYVLQQTAIEENAQAEAAGNDLTETIIDRQAGKGFRTAERTIDMRYGSGGVLQLMRVVEAAVKKSIKNTTNVRSGSLMNDWEWQSTDALRSSSGALAFGDVIRYVPTGQNRLYASFVNHLVAENGGKKIPFNGDRGHVNFGLDQIKFVPIITVRRSLGTGKSRPARSKGFMAKAVNSIRRSPAARGFHVKVQSVRY